MKTENIYPFGQLQIWFCTCVVLGDFGTIKMHLLKLMLMQYCYNWMILQLHTFNKTRPNVVTVMYTWYQTIWGTSTH